MKTAILKFYIHLTKNTKMIVSICVECIEKGILWIKQNKYKYRWTFFFNQLSLSQTLFLVKDDFFYPSEIPISFLAPRYSIFPFLEHTPYFKNWWSRIRKKKSISR